MSQEFETNKPDDDIFKKIINPDILENVKKEGTTTPKKNKLEAIEYEKEYMEASERMQKIYNEFNSEFQIELSIRLLSAYEIPISKLNVDIYEIDSRIEYQIRFKHIEVALIYNNNKLTIKPEYRIYGYNDEFYGFECFDKNNRRNVPRKTKIQK